MDGAFDIAAGEAAEKERKALPDRIRLPLTFDPAPLVADLDAFAERDWQLHVVRQNYEGAWRIVPLRGPAGETHPIRLAAANPGTTHFADTALMDRAPHVRALLARLLCPLRSVRLMSLSPGSTIREHCDPALDADSGTIRLHVPILTSPEVEFLLNRRPVTMEAGSCWYLRLTDPHQAVNRGAADRVHLVIDAHMNDWLDMMLREGMTG